MASTKFLDEDLRTDVDESTVSAIVGGSLETNLVTATTEVNTSLQQQKLHQQQEQNEQRQEFQQNFVNINNNLLNSNQDNNSSSAILVTNGGPILLTSSTTQNKNQQQQQHTFSVNSESNNVLQNNNNNNHNINNNSNNNNNNSSNTSSSNSNNIINSNSNNNNNNNNTASNKSEIAPGLASFEASKSNDISSNDSENTHSTSSSSLATPSSATWNASSIASEHIVSNISSSSSGRDVPNLYTASQQDSSKSHSNPNEFYNVADIQAHSRPISSQEQQTGSVDSQRSIQSPVVTNTTVSSTPSVSDLVRQQPPIGDTGPAVPISQHINTSQQHQQHLHHQQHQLQQHQLRQAQQIISQPNLPQSTMSKNNEPVKLVYPSSVGSSQPAVLMNNRVTFTSQSLPNGTINLATLSSQQQQNIMHTSTSMTAGTGTNTVTGQQQQTIVIKNQGTNQNIVGNSMMPGAVQLVNMRPNTPTAQTKTVATVSPRVVISSPHMVATRPANPGITLGTLPGQPGSALLLKTENGQYRLLHVGPQTAQQTLPNSGANPTIRIQTVPSIQSIASSTATPIVVNSVHTTPAINTTATRTRENLVSSQLARPQTMNAGKDAAYSSITPVASVAPVTHQTIAHHQVQQPQQHIQHTQVNASNQVPATVNVVTNTTPSQANLHNTKEKCRKFLSNLLELSSREPKPVEQNVQELIQELIDANVEPDEFCDRLERLLNASPQPCLIGFLKKSLPLLRQSLCTKELSIDGIKPPPHSVAFGPYQTANITTQVRPGVPTLTSIGNVRMVSQAARPTITRHAAPGVRIQTPINVPRMVNSTQIRTATGATIIQQHPPNIQMQSHPPALHPVSQNTFAPGGAQIRAANVNMARPAPGTVQIRQTQPTVKATDLPNNTDSKLAKNFRKAQNASIINAAGQPAIPTTIKVGSTQIKPIINVANVQPAPVLIQQAATNSTNNSSTINTSTPAESPKVVIQNSSQQKPDKVTSVTNVPTTLTTTIPTAANATAFPPPKMVPIKNQSAAQANSAASKANATNKEKERKASASFYQQSSMSSSMYGDDDINDVAAMGGVNLAEESQRILGSTELIGRQIRSCKDEVFLHLPALQAKIRNIVARHGLEEPNSEVAVLVSHACQERLKNIIEKLAVIAEHRIDIIKIDPRYEITKDVRGQIKFLEELDKAEQKRHEEQEREMLMRAAKSRSKTEDPEQAKLKAKAKEMQRAEMEELRQRDANLTALQAIGPRKKPKLENDTATAITAGGNSLGIGGTSSAPLRPRIKRVNLRDMIFYLEQEQDTCRSSMLYKSYLK